jgi:hypothetical protein
MWKYQSVWPTFVYPWWKMTHRLQNVVFHKWALHGFFFLLKLLLNYQTQFRNDFLLVKYRMWVFDFLRICNTRGYLPCVIKKTERKRKIPRRKRSCVTEVWHCCSKGFIEMIVRRTARNKIMTNLLLVISFLLLFYKIETFFNDAIHIFLCN